MHTHTHTHIYIYIYYIIRNVASNVIYFTHTRGYIFHFQLSDRNKIAFWWALSIFEQVSICIGLCDSWTKAKDI